MLKSKEKIRGKTYDLLLRGLTVCKECGRKMAVMTEGRGKNVRYLRCSSYSAFPLQRRCKSHLINYNKLESAVIIELQNICKAYLSQSKIKEIIKEENKEVTIENRVKQEKTIIKKKLKELNTQIDKLYEDKLTGLISNEDFKRIYEKKSTEKEEKIKRFQELSKLKLGEGKIDYAKVIASFLTKENVTNYMLTALIDKIEIDEKKQVIINYKFSPLNNI